MTNTQLKSQIDLEITNKVATNSVTPSNVGENIKDVIDYIDQEIADIELTQGPTGPAGVAGPVGPTGLQWRGIWASGTSYVVNDAVGYNGASWFCISATSGTTSPNLDPTKWALLAAQGSPGPQGAQGIQGPSGTAPYKSYVAILGPGALSTAPPNVNSLVFNNTGGIISFTRIQTGVYAANITGATFTSGKTVCFATPMYFGATDNITKIGRFSNSEVRITTLTNNVYATDGVIDCQIEIRVYN